MPCHHSCACVWGPLSCYTCRATRVAADVLGFSCMAVVSHYSPLKGPVAPIARKLPRVSHVKLPLKRCCTTGGCSNYTCEYRATLCHYGCHPLNRNTTELWLWSGCFVLILHHSFFHVAAWPTWVPVAPNKCRFLRLSAKVLQRQPKKREKDPNPRELLDSPMGTASGREN